MKSGKVNILSTRPVGRKLLEQAAMNDIIIDEISFIETKEIIDNKLEKKIEQLSQENINAVFTSMSSVEALRKFIPRNSSWKIFCIGNTTTALAKKIFGENSIAGTANDALHLAENIISREAIKKVYFFCGNQRRDELPEKLRGNKIEVEEVIVYKTIETSQLISKNYDGILFFSPSAVKSFFLKNHFASGTQAFAIGQTTADSLKPFLQQHVIIADVPGKKNLVEKAINYFRKTHVC